SFGHLGPRTTNLLVAVALFQGVAQADILGILSSLEDAPARFQSISGEDWNKALDEAAGVGLLSVLGAGMYRIHPALPAYLAAKWQAEDPDRYEEERACGVRALLAAYSSF